MKKVLAFVLVACMASIVCGLLQQEQLEKAREARLGKFIKMNIGPDAPQTLDNVNITYTQSQFQKTFHLSRTETDKLRGTQYDLSSNAEMPILTLPDSDKPPVTYTLKTLLFANVLEPAGTTAFVLVFKAGESKVVISQLIESSEISTGSEMASLVATMQSETEKGEIDVSLSALTKVLDLVSSGNKAYKHTFSGNNPFTVYEVYPNKVFQF